MPTRIPRRLKLVHGTLQPCRDRPELELPPVEGAPEPPDFLDIEGAKEFTRVAGILTAARVLAAADLGLLTAYAAQWSVLVKLWRLGMRPLAAELMAFTRLAGELGLTIRSRASLPPAPEAPRKNPFDNLGRRPEPDPGADPSPRARRKRQ